MLFSDRSLWTMAHGIVLGGGALMGLAAALFALCAAEPSRRARDAALRHQHFEGDEEVQVQSGQIDLMHDE